MTQVLEYITQNYTLFLVGAIIILLAVIGYYAEKTNFGQGKVDEIEDEKKDNDQKKLSSTDLMDVGNSDANGFKNNAEKLINNENDITSNIKSTENLIYNNSIKPITDSLENIENTIESSEQVNENRNLEKDVVNELSNNDVIFAVEEIKNTELEEKKKEEEFNKFSDEFDAILPKREIINDDLLSEIEELELGKTQKFNLKDLKTFESIKLPRISDTVTEDQDIWKF